MIIIMMCMNYTDLGTKGENIVDTSSVPCHGTGCPLTSRNVISYESPWCDDNIPWGGGYLEKQRASLVLSFDDCYNLQGPTSWQATINPATHCGQFSHGQLTPSWSSACLVVLTWRIYRCVRHADRRHQTCCGHVHCKAACVVATPTFGNRCLAFRVSCTHDNRPCAVFFLF
jgi:hypothetical protein